MRKEEIRGIFVLGLLAVLASIRIQQKELIVTIGQNSLNVMFLLDITIIFWSFYAFFMVLALSEDIIGKTAAANFKETAKLFLRVNFFLLAAFSLLLAVIGYGARLFWASLVLLVLAASGIVARARKTFKGIRKPSTINLRDFLKTVVDVFLMVVISFSLILLVFSKEETWIIPAALAGCSAGVALVIVREKWRDNRVPKTQKDG